MKTLILSKDCVNKVQFSLKDKFKNMQISSEDSGKKTQVLPKDHIKFVKDFGKKCEFFKSLR